MHDSQWIFARFFLLCFPLPSWFRFLVILARFFVVFLRFISICCIEATLGGMADTLPQLLLGRPGGGSEGSRNGKAGGSEGIEGKTLQKGARDRLRALIISAMTRHGEMTWR